MDLNTPSQHTNTNIASGNIFGNTPSMHGNRPPRPPLAPVGGASGSGNPFGGESSLTNGLGMGMTNEISMSGAKSFDSSGNTMMTSIQEKTNQLIKNYVM
mgnify:CR=1 FL=1